MSSVQVPRRPSPGVVGGISPRLTPAVVWSLLGETLYEWYEDRAPRLGAALAYYTVFALAPGLIVIIALAALLLGKEAAQGQILDEVQDLIGFAGAQAIQAAVESARDAGGSLVATGLGVLTLLFGLWGVFGELQDALNTIWGVTTRPGRGVMGAIKARFWSFTMVVGIGFSRVALAAHFVSDVLAGFALGAVWLGMMTAIFRPWRHIGDVRAAVARPSTTPGSSKGRDRPAAAG